MTNKALQETIESWFPLPEFVQPGFTEEGSQFLNVSIDPESLRDLMSLLFNHPDTQFDYLFCLTGVDYGKELGVVYHLESTIYRHTIVVKVQTEDREDPVFDSVQDIWATANYHEREVYDFFGIKFRNHPNMKRLFLTDDWEGFPLRKDYVDEVNMVVK